MMMRGQTFMNSLETRSYFGQLVDRLGIAVLLVVAVGAMLIWAYYWLLWAGIEESLHKYFLVYTYDAETGQDSTVPLRVHIDLVAIPLAAIAAAWLRWGAGWIAASRASRVGPLLPLLGAVVLSGVFWYWAWWVYNPHHLFGIHPQFGVQRWISVALMAGAGYGGMMLFPRLTASMAGAVAGPALFAVLGYTLFPSFMGAVSDLNTITDAEARLADALAGAGFLGTLAVAIAAILAMRFSARLRRHPLSYALWVGALTLCMAVSGTFNGSHPGI